jgi:regulator of protease activity HflC (stomatin/prohibitin superfamily)
VKSAVNVAVGQKQKVVLESEAVRQKQINEATGQAEDSPLAFFLFFSITIF